MDNRVVRFDWIVVERSVRFRFVESCAADASEGLCASDADLLTDAFECPVMGDRSVPSTQNERSHEGSFLLFEF